MGLTISQQLDFREFQQHIGTKNYDFFIRGTPEDHITYIANINNVLPVSGEYVGRDGISFVLRKLFSNESVELRSYTVNRDFRKVLFTLKFSKLRLGLFVILELYGKGKILKTEIYPDIIN